MSQSSRTQILIILTGALLFIPFLGQVHLFDWDEINFAEAAREMLVTGDYLNVQINFQPFWENPPLFIWMQALSMNIFGINEFAARFPNALCGIITLLVLYNMGKKVRNHSFGLYWVIAYAGSILPFFYFKSGIIDPWFNLFIFLGIYFFILYEHEQKDSKRILHIVLSAAGIGLAILTKGPVGLLIFGLTALIYLIIRKFYFTIKLRDVLLYIVIVILIGGFWFLLQLLNGNFDIIRDFIVYQIDLFQSEGAGHGGFLFYHWVVLLIGVYPASILGIKGFSGKLSDNDNFFQKNFRMWMIILFFTVLILFTIVNTKIVHYSSMCYFPLTFLAAHVIYKISHERRSFSRKWFIGLLILALLYTLIIAALPVIDAFKHTVIQQGWIRDPFVIGNLHASPHWSGFEALTGLLLMAGILVSVRFFRQQQIPKAFISLFVSAMIFTYVTLGVITPKIEKYTQHAVIEFYQQLQGKDVYVDPLGFKSYAHLFYTRKQGLDDPRSVNEKWLLTGDIDKRAYFVMKVHKADSFLNKYPQLQRVYQKNGFVFAVRNPQKEKMHD